MGQGGNMHKLRTILVTLDGDRGQACAVMVLLDGHEIDWRRSKPACVQGANARAYVSKPVWRERVAITVTQL